MPSHTSLLPGFGWLLPKFRPTREEVRAYAKFIRAADPQPVRRPTALLRQAELQLWVWRTENRLLPPTRRRAVRTRRVADTDGDPSTIIGALPAL
jgi:hypothetical protein